MEGNRQTYEEIWESGFVSSIFLRGKEDDKHEVILNFKQVI